MTSMRRNEWLAYPTKLVMVSVWFRGRQKTIFVRLPVINGKIYYDATILARELGARGGETFTIG